MIKILKKLSKKKIKKFLRTEKNRKGFANWMVSSIHPEIKSFPRLTTNYIIDNKFNNYINRKENFSFKIENISCDKILDIRNQIINNTKTFEDKLFFSTIDVTPKEIDITERFLDELFIDFKYRTIICSTETYYYAREALGSKKMLNRVDKNDLLINRYDQEDRTFLLLKDFAVLFIGLIIKITINDGYVNFNVENKFKLHIDPKGCITIVTPTVDIGLIK